MATINARGISRRNFLSVGTLGLAGLTLGDVLRLRAQPSDPARPKHKSVIMICLPGGPSHIDSYDMKPDARAEYRGEFKPIPTKVPGTQICELLPLQAQLADRYTILRGLKYAGKDHNVDEMLTGFPLPEKRPAFGSVVSRLRGDDGLPPYVSFGGLSLGNSDDSEVPRYAGSAHRPFKPSGPGLDNLRLSRSVNLQRLDDRKGLLTAFDTLNRDLDTRGTMSGMDSFNAKALEMVCSTRARDAFDVTREPDRLREKYGKDMHLLMARRLVEAGVSVVTVGFTRPPGWDTHQNNFKSLRLLLPELDRAVHTLVTDLYDRGLDRDVAVLLWGEFGRSPVISDAGRDHWPDAGAALVVGGGLKMGQVIGETDSRGERAKGRPYTLQNVFSTLYHVLGIDPASALSDFSGRPVCLLDDPQRIEPLF